MRKFQNVAFGCSVMVSFFIFYSGSSGHRLAEAESQETPEQTVNRACGHCHAVKIKDQCVAGDCDRQQTQTTRARDWERLTDWMIFFNCQMTNQEQKIITEFLKSQYPGQPSSITWTHVETVPLGWNTVSMTPSGNYLYIGVEGGGRIYRSSDGSAWEEVADTGHGTVYGITFFKGKLYAGTDVPNAEIWSSTDGKQWAKVIRLPDDEDGVSAMGVFKEHLYAGTRRTGIYRSPDGIRWTRLTRLEDTRAYFRFLVEFKDHLYAGYEPGGRIFRSADGEVWTEVGQPLRSPVGVRGIAAFHGALYVGTNSPAQIWKTEDGLNWTKIFDPTPDEKRGYVGSLAVFGDYLYAGVNANTERPIDV